MISRMMTIIKTAARNPATNIPTPNPPSGKLLLAAVSFEVTACVYVVRGDVSQSVHALITTSSSL